MAVAQVTLGIKLAPGLECLRNLSTPCDFFLWQGDSGGPMVCDGVVQGIVSFGNSFPPGVYTRIAKYLQWIKKTMG